jgi:hypothetical protein
LEFYYSWSKALSVAACFLLRISVGESATTRAESASAASTYSLRQQETEAEFSRLLGYTSTYYFTCENQGDLGHRKAYFDGRRD